jgi:predicted nucleic acid-binding protein
MSFLWRSNLPDEGDNHVMELAIAANAEAIVTQNARDFRSGELRIPDLEVLTPAEFLRKDR